MDRYDRFTSPRQDAKVAPTQSEEEHRHLDHLQTVPPPKEQINQDHPSNAYKQPFTLEAALSLSLDDQNVPWYLQGYDLFIETRTSKYHAHSPTIIHQRKRKISTPHLNKLVMTRRGLVPGFKDELGTGGGM